MTGGVESLGRIRMQGILLLVVTFAIGALAGVAGDRLVARGHGRGRMGLERGAIRGPRFRFLDRLHLSDLQRRKVDSILVRARPRADSLLRETMPKLQALRDSIGEEIRSLLSPEQQELFDRDRAAHHRRTERLRRDAGPVPGDTTAEGPSNSDQDAEADVEL